MKRHVAALVAIVLLASATPSEGPDRAASLASGPSLRGVPLSLPGSDPARHRGDGGSIPQAVSGGTPPRTAGEPIASPSGAIGTALVGGWAAFCDPTPTRCQSWKPPALLGAMPGFTFGDEPFAARVCTDGSQCVVVTVLSFCACGDRHGIPTVIDLSPAAMEAIEPDYRRLGIVRVTVEFPVTEPAVTLPPTDVMP